MLGLWTSEKGYPGRLPLREGGWEGGREGHQMPLAVDFPQVQLVYIYCTNFCWKNQVLSTGSTNTWPF